MIAYDPTHPDPMLSEYAARVEAGDPAPHDRAMSAFERAEQAGSILMGNREDIEPGAKRAILTRIERVATLAALVARADALDLDADALARQCEQEALALDALDLARFNGLARSAPLCNKHLRGR